MTISIGYQPVLLEVSGSGEVVTPLPFALMQGVTSIVVEYFSVPDNAWIVVPVEAYTANGTVAGGTATIFASFNDLLPKPTKYRISRWTPKTQPAELNDRQQIPSKTLEKALDTLEVQLQEVAASGLSIEAIGPATEELRIAIAAEEATRSNADEAIIVSLGNHEGVVADTDTLGHVKIGDGLQKNIVTGSLEIKFGEVTGTVCAGDDPRLTSVEPHATTHAFGGSDRITPPSIEAAYANHTHLVATSTSLGFVKGGSDSVFIDPDGTLHAVGGGGGGGTLDHSDLTAESRALPNQHPQSAIQYLETDLAAKADIADMTAKLNAKANANHSHADATESKAGFMSAMDKAKLDGMRSSVYVGEIRMFPFRAAQLPAGWYFANGDLYAVASAQGTALNGLSTEYKSDWGIAVSGANINLPKLFYTDGRGYFLRAGTTPGVVQNDAIRNITGEYYPQADVGAINLISGYNGVASGAFKAGAKSIANNIQPRSASSSNNLLFDASGSVPTASENRPINVSMTPAIYLGV